MDSFCDAETNFLLIYIVESVLIADAPPIFVNFCPLPRREEEKRGGKVKSGRGAGDERRETRDGK
jgi:hypothetical protein